MLVVFILACALHLYAWCVHPGSPSLTNERITGWYGGAADQINYMLEARALAAGQLPGTYWDYDRSQPKLHPPQGAIRSDYAYGLGYPILAAPFVRLGLERDPFLVPDTIAFGLIICLALLLARRFLTGGAAILFAGMLAVASPLLPFTVMPWNTTITGIAVLASLVFATSQRRDWKVGLALGAILSLCYAARYTDVVWPIAIVGAGMLSRRSANVKGTVAAAAAMVMMLGVAYVGVGWTQRVVFGNFFTNPYHYHMHNGTRGDSLAEFRPGQIPRAFTEVFVTARAGSRLVREPHTSVLRAFPWVVAAPFGILLLLQRRHRERHVVLAAGAASVVASAFYLAYWSGTGADLENNNLRFFVPWFPFWGLLAAVAIAEAVRYGGTALQDATLPAEGATAAPWLHWCLAAVLMAAILALIAHVGARPRVHIDLIERFSQAEKKPLGASFETRDQRILGETKRAISASPPSRFTWKLTIPYRARLTVALGAGGKAGSESETVEFRIGVSDDQTYTDLCVRHVNPHDVARDRRWLPVTVDLAAYAGRTLSLIFNTDILATPGQPHGLQAYWGAPFVSGYVP